MESLAPFEVAVTKMQSISFFTAQIFNRETKPAKEVADQITPDNIVPYMLESRQVWSIMEKTTVLIEELRRAERQRSSEA